MVVLECGLDMSPSRSRSGPAYPTRTIEIVEELPGSRPKQAPAPPPPPPPPESVPALWSVGIGLLFLVVYLFLAPTVTGDQDASEFTLTLASGGIPHPSGYPIYAWCGYWFCFALHSLGLSYSYAANAWSAVGGGIAMGVFHALAARAPSPQAKVLRPVRMAIATITTVLVGLNPVWTANAAVAEVHSWHLAWVGTLALLFLIIVRGLREPWSNRRVALLVTAWGLLLGLGAAHHLSGIVFAAPLTVVLIMALMRSGRWRWVHVPLLVAGTLPPLASYGYVFWRAMHPATFQWPPLERSREAALHHIMGGGYASYFGRFAPGDLQQTALSLYIYPFLFSGLLVLAIAAWAASPRSERLVRMGLLAAGVIQTTAAFLYGVPDPAAYFLPALWIAMLVLPIGIAAARRSMRIMLIAAGAAGVVVAAVSWIRVAAERRESFAYVDAHLRALWRDIPYDRAIVIWPRDMYSRFIEYQRFDGLKPNLYVTQPNLLTYRGPRADFQRRFGFDPLERVQVRSEAELDRVLPESINRRTALPVVLVDRIGFAARTLPKPQPVATPAAADTVARPSDAVQAPASRDTVARPSDAAQAPASRDTVPAGD
jgi:hypothetical protein